MEMQLSELAKSLKSEFEKIKNKKAPLKDSQLKQRIQKIQQLLERMMQQLSRQTKGLPDEFINSKAIESLDLNKLNESLQEIMKMVKQGQIDNAIDTLEKLTKDLNTLAQQLDEAASQMEGLVDVQLMEKLDRITQELLMLEKEEKKLLEDTTIIHKSLRAEQLQSFGDILKELFVKLTKDVNKIQSILKGSAEFLNENAEMEKYEDLLNRENRLENKIHRLRQETIESSLKPRLSEIFKELHKTQNELAKLTIEKQGLSLKTYDDFKTYLPEFLEKYDSLEELANLFDV